MGAVGSRRDDTERHPVEVVSSVLDESPEPVLLVARGGRIGWANRACERLFGTPRETLVGRSLAEFADGDGVAVAPAVPSDPFALRRPDGELRWVCCSASPLRGDPAGGLVVYLRDDTVRRRDELRWTRRHDELEQMIRAVSHDLRSPLVAVLGFSRLLREDFGDRLGERGRHYVDRIAEAGRTMEALIRELLDFARIGHAGEKRSLVDPCGVLRQLLGELKPQLDAQGVELRIPEEPPLLLCDRTRLYQLLSNLIRNALDHMGPCEQPRIDVEIAEEGEWSRISVSDNGRGIEPGERERVFEVFHTIARAEGRRGTGIGLAIVKKIAELHGGRAWVESEPGAGASFRILLPRP